MTGQSSGSLGGGGAFLLTTLPGGLCLGLRWTLMALGFALDVDALPEVDDALDFLVAAMIRDGYSDFLFDQ